MVDAGSMSSAPARGSNITTSSPFICSSSSPPPITSSSSVPVSHHKPEEREQEAEKLFDPSQPSPFFNHVNEPETMMKNSKNRCHRVYFWVPVNLLLINTSAVPQIQLENSASWTQFSPNRRARARRRLQQRQRQCVDLVANIGMDVK